MRKSLLALSCVALICCSACQRGADRERSPVAYEAALNTADLMHLVIEPSADVLWDSAGWVMTLEGEFSLTPQTEEEWLAAESAAGIIIESGDLLKIPQRSSEHASSWITYASNMAQEGKRAREAILSRDGDALFEAGATLYQSCVSCHNEYWPSTSSK